VNTALKATAKSNGKGEGTCTVCDNLHLDFAQCLQRILLITLLQPTLQAW
jgi:hypothetical protein